jgi:hypothetical protein
MLKCPCCGAFITNTWEEKNALRRMLNREFAAMRRDKTRKKKYGKRSTRIDLTHKSEGKEE